MKQEKIAMSMSYIDDDLIIEAAKVRKPATRSVKWQTVAIRFVQRRLQAYSTDVANHY